MKDKTIGDITSATIVKDEKGRQYHIGLAQGELAENIILVGDPGRVGKVKHFFSEIYLETTLREFHTITGRVEEMDLSIMSTGIGPSNVEISMIEIMQITNTPNIIRAGSCGAFHSFINIGDLVISTGSVRFEDTSTHYIPDGYPAIANFEVILALSEAADQNNLPYHIGLTASASGFYGAQGREIPGLPTKNSHLPDELANVQVLNIEMEASILFNLAQILKFRAGMVCTVFANRTTNQFIPTKLKNPSEVTCVRTAIDALRILNQMDEVKLQNKTSNWLPRLSLPK